MQNHSTQVSTFGCLLFFFFVTKVKKKLKGHTCLNYYNYLFSDIHILGKPSKKTIYAGRNQMVATPQLVICTHKNAVPVEKSLAHK